MTEQEAIEAAIEAAIDAARTLENFCITHKKLERKTLHEVELVCECPFLLGLGRCLLGTHPPDYWAIDDEMFFVGGGAFGDAKEKLEKEKT